MDDGKPSYAEVAAPNGVNGVSDNSSDNLDTKHVDGGAELSENGAPPAKPYSVNIPEQPVTAERSPYVPKEGDALIDAGTARATIAPSNESPNGATDGNWAKEHEHQTVVMQHMDYFDPDHDGVIWPRDTYNGFRKWGWSIILSLYGTFLINGFISYPTAPGILPDPFFRIFVSRAYKGKHGSDSMSYDNEGRFVPQNFENIFAKYDRDNKGGLNWLDLIRAFNGQRLVFDFFGWSAVFFEWLGVYLLLWPDDGILRKEDVRGVFDGSIFQKKADEYQRKKETSTQDKQRRFIAWKGRKTA
ncbi:MAG: hypothetical protein M1819_007460 [Sarea resinae]|nr:MAG: hypothetical protein M1819_007460 [Sarea resinae]